MRSTCCQRFECQLRDDLHGVNGEVEAGKGQITRYANGQRTRFTFKKPFARTPNVQITPILSNRSGAFQSFYLYLLNPTEGPPVNETRFYLGIFSSVGNTVQFSYFANDVDGEDED
ncbi:uncharacterized protein N7473_009979 [Penicillium subrubescens]|uniref:uncharacterized protein n=1 Tax=Penicillium subrubescens TaxID=1316194 RepID=UPI0025456934|nr:uncharacterized protein N7473_009979 [Penicillium subrubescens]KAJ5883093.1 hypothetical protein N7473_009979 [Penicillium subrubescens]